MSILNTVEVISLSLVSVMQWAPEHREYCEINKPDSFCDELFILLHTVKKIGKSFRPTAQKQFHSALLKDTAHCFVIGKRKNSQKLSWNFLRRKLIKNLTVRIACKQTNNGVRVWLPFLGKKWERQTERGIDREREREGEWK